MMLASSCCSLGVDKLNLATLLRSSLFTRPLHGPLAGLLRAVVAAPRQVLQKSCPAFAECGAIHAQRHQPRPEGILHIENLRPPCRDPFGIAGEVQHQVRQLTIGTERHHIRRLRKASEGDALRRDRNACQARAVNSIMGSNHRNHITHGLTLGGMLRKCWIYLPAPPNQCLPLISRYRLAVSAYYIFLWFGACIFLRIII